jgi:hypothetical protein
LNGVFFERDGSKTRTMSTDPIGSASRRGEQRGERFASRSGDARGSARLRPEHDDDDAAEAASQRANRLTVERPCARRATSTSSPRLRELALGFVRQAHADDRPCADRASTRGSHSAARRSEPFLVFASFAQRAGARTAAPGLAARARIPGGTAVAS